MIAVFRDLYMVYLTAKSVFFVCDQYDDDDDYF